MYCCFPKILTQTEVYFLANSRPDKAKVRPSKEFQRPLCQFFDAALCYLYSFMQDKHLKFTSIMSNFKKNKPIFLRPAIQFFSLNLAREQKSLATPALDQCFSTQTA